MRLLTGKEDVSYVNMCCFVLQAIFKKIIPEIQPFRGQVLEST